MTERLEEGYRTDLAKVSGAVADLDAHHVVVDFPHEVMDNYRTDWGRGCWDESFQKRLPVMVWNHNPDLLIGAGHRAENLGDRSRVVQRFANFDAVPQARAAHSMIDDGIVPGFSFHFRNARSVAHPDVRGARRFVKADMLEVSPVTFPSIPGAVAVGIRSQEATLDIPTIDQILQLRDRGLLDDEGVRSMIAEHHPILRDHIRITIPPEPTPQEPTPQERAAELLADSGLRDMVIRIGSDGTVSTDGAPAAASGDDGSDDDGDAATLAQDTDAALDEACRLLDAVDVTGLPDTVQQAVALVQAAGVAVDELLDVMGLSDPDEDGQVDDTGDRAMMTTEQMNDLPDSCFAYVEPGGTKDGSGKTVPRAKRHYPIKTASGAPDKAHIRDALARAAAAMKGDNTEAKTVAEKAMPAIKAAAKQAGIGEPADAGKRSDDPTTDPAADPAGEPALMVDLDRVLEKLNRR